MSSIASWLRFGILFGPLLFHAAAADVNAVHGLWVWKSRVVLQAPGSAKSLLDFCRAQGINEVYISTSGELESPRITDLIALLHRSNVRVEALLSSIDADEPGKPREKLLEHVREIAQFNRQHSGQRFDGIHLDVEPQQRSENKGAGNLRFLPDLVNTYRAVRSLAGQHGMIVNADIQNKLLKGGIGERKILLSAVPRLTLMLYELSSPVDGDSTSQKSEKLLNAAQKFLDMAYQGLDGADLAKMTIALRTPDYGPLLPAMLKALDGAFRTNSHYLGWARHSYNDSLQP